MTDPLGLIGSSIPPVRPPQGPGAASDPHRPEGPDFRALLEEQLAQVNELQQDAKEATEDFVTGRRDDVEGVILATQKADTAFRMLLQVRNKMMEAYDAVQQIRV